MSWDREIDELHERTAMAHRMGGEDKVARQHEFGPIVRHRAERHRGLVDQRRRPHVTGARHVSQSLDRMHRIECTEIRGLDDGPTRPQFSASTVCRATSPVRYLEAPWQ